MIPVMVPDMIAPDEEMRELSAKICGSLPEVLEFLRREDSHGKSRNTAEYHRDSAEISF